ncbi:putative phosphatase [Vibrio astriarenae]|nr:putative phosphatase [Vibrio sp. C7]
MVFARLAATQVGATTMDRPEWVAVHPELHSVFVTLTNNKNRGVKENQPINAANPREKNPYGHIVRWQPTGSDHTAATFEWDIFVMAGNPDVHPSGSWRVLTILTLTICLTALMVSVSIALAAYGYKRMASTQTKVTLPVWATTRCCVATQRQVRFADL